VVAKVLIRTECEAHCEYCKHKQALSIVIRRFDYICGLSVYASHANFVHYLQKVLQAVRPGERPVESIAASFLASRLRASPEHRGMELVPPDTEASVNLALAALVDSVVLRLV
jgi:hypothetical protein